MAAAVATAVEPRRPVAVLGHSLGGAVGLALAAGDHGATVVAVTGVGVKVRWSDDELAGAAAVAAKPARTFASREEAVDRALRVAGLAGLVAPGSDVADSLVTEDADGWRTTFDTRALASATPSGRRCSPSWLQRGIAVTLAAGEHDPMSPPGRPRRPGRAPGGAGRPRPQRPRGGPGRPAAARRGLSGPEATAATAVTERRKNCVRTRVVRDPALAAPPGEARW